VNQVNTVAHQAKRKIESLDKENEAATQLPGAGIGSANERTRTTITAGLKKKLRDLMGE
jgi:syntaxin 1B/2/3